jgi:ribosomal protein S6--L-glutamate ligase
MILSFHPCFTADEEILLADRPLDSRALHLIQESQAIIVPQSCPGWLYAACRNSDAHIFPSYEMRFKYPGKMGQSLLFRQFQFSVPQTCRWETVRAFQEAFPELEILPHELPFLIKTDQDHEAEGVFVVEERTTLSELLNELARQERSGRKGFVSQVLIEAEGNALRAVIIGQQIITYWKRPETPGQLITTIGRGARIDHHWRPDLQEKGRSAAKTLARKTGINLAAVDFVFSLSEAHPEPLFLEINYYFGRRGLGGSETFYKKLHTAIIEWVRAIGLDPKSIRLI